MEHSGRRMRGSVRLFLAVLLAFSVLFVSGGCDARPSEFEVLGGKQYVLTPVAGTSPDFERSKKAIEGRLKTLGVSCLVVKGRESALQVSVYGEQPYGIEQMLAKPTVLQVKTERGSLLFENADIVKAFASYDENGDPCIQLELNTKATSVMAEFTSENMYSTYFYAVDGETISAPSVSKVLSNGKPQITGMYTWDEAIGFAARLLYPMDFGYVLSESMDIPNRTQGI